MGNFLHPCGRNETRSSATLIGSSAASYKFSHCDVSPFPQMARTYPFPSQTNKCAILVLLNDCMLLCVSPKHLPSAAAEQPASGCPSFWAPIMMVDYRNGCSFVFSFAIHCWRTRRLGGYLATPKLVLSGSLEFDHNLASQLPGTGRQLINAN